MDIGAFFKLSYGLYIVSSIKGEEKNGYIGNVAFQVTAEPPTLAISTNKDNYTYEFIKESGLFSVSILNKDVNPQLIQTFGYSSGKDVDKFKNVDFKLGETGVPIVLNDSNALFECKVIDQIEIGTHAIFVGDILSAELLQEFSDPLTYSHYRNVLKGKAPKNAPTYVDESKYAAPAEEDIHVCQLCNYEYVPSAGDPDKGVAPGTSFEDIPDDWTCPICGATKDLFELKN